ncbi:MAG: hypothetical protein PUF90_00220 [Lachnospiraceae bacterium]|nr:hypothetical protein [Lachnospiraceae bacterium]
MKAEGGRRAGEIGKLCRTNETGSDMCMTGAYDIIIMDGMLPGQDGIEIIYEMRYEPADES